MADLPKCLNLGSGNKRMADAVNVDRVSETEPDIVHNLNVRPWPLPSNHFTEVHAKDVIEHLDDVILTMEEVHRVCRPGARVHITLPHFSSSNSYTDPTHRHGFGWFSFHYVTGEHHFSFYTQCRYRRVVEQLIFHPTLENKVVSRLANRYPEAYERRWAWSFPAWFLYFQLEVLK